MCVIQKLYVAGPGSASESNDAVDSLRVCALTTQKKESPAIPASDSKSQIAAQLSQYVFTPCQPVDLRRQG